MGFDVVDIAPPAQIRSAALMSADPPKKPKDIKDLKVAVLVFPGRPKTDADITDQVAKLGALLDAAAVQYNKDVFVYAGYDSPFRVFDRHNEVWLYLL